MYLKTKEQLESMRMIQYDAQNYARLPGMKSIHQMMYWEVDRDFLGFGMGATSLENSFRIKRPTTKEGYKNYVD